LAGNADWGPASKRSDPLVTPNCRKRTQAMRVRYSPISEGIFARVRTGGRAPTGIAPAASSGIATAGVLYLGSIDRSLSTINTVASRAGAKAGSGARQVLPPDWRERMGNRWGLLCPIARPTKEKGTGRCFVF
jgi:hypothetical protein